MRVETPSSVDVVRSNHNCYVNLNRKRSNVCDFVGREIIEITGAFTQIGYRGNYTDTVEIVFLAENPSRTNNDELSLNLEVYLDHRFLYKIAEIEDGLTPTFECEWPCKTCSPADSLDCQSCFEGRTEREFLQEDRETGTNTCVGQCNNGYTFDKYATHKVCFPCDESCAMCRNGGDVDDRIFCTSCARGYPYYWSETAQCFPQDLGCPNGSFEYSDNKCRSCPDGCARCE